MFITQAMRDIEFSLCKLKTVQYFFKLHRCVASIFTRLKNTNFLAYDGKL